MPNESTEMINLNDVGSSKVQEAAITVTSVVVTSLAVVGTVVVAKMMIAEIRENRRITKEMKALYKEHKKTKSVSN